MKDAIKYTEALEIAVSEYLGESWSLVKTLIADCENQRAEIAKLKEELSYAQTWLLASDGRICTCCEKVRHVDDMVRGSEERHGVEGWFCSDDCADKAQRHYEEHCGVEDDEDFNERMGVR